MFWWIGGDGEESEGLVEKELELKGAKRTIKAVIDATASMRLRRIEIARSHWRFGSWRAEHSGQEKRSGFMVEVEEVSEEASNSCFDSC